jgi:hypothetical protein
MLVQENPYKKKGDNSFHVVTIIVRVLIKCIALLINRSLGRSLNYTWSYESKY